MAVKKQSRLKKIVSAFNPKSFRGGMALFALLFAITGGGYMLYCSFAATTYANILVNKAGKIFNNGNYSITWKQTDSNGGVPLDTKIWRLKREVDAAVYTKYRVFAPVGSGFTRTIKICVKYRFTDKSKHNAIRFWPDNGVTKVYPAADGSFTYRTLCSLPTKASIYNGYTTTWNVSVYNAGIFNSFTGTHPGDMYIRNISIQW